MTGQPGRPCRPVTHAYHCYGLIDASLDLRRRLAGRHGPPSKGKHVAKGFESSSLIGRCDCLSAQLLAENLRVQT
jgi:hypothetical protein